jgi:hypothetical protein
MNRSTFLRAALAAAATTALPLPHASAQTDEGLVIVTNPLLKGIDTEMVRRIYTGRVVELDGLPLRPVNLAPASPVRQRFLRALLQQTEQDYVGYWTVRRYIGKGVPPQDLRSSDEVIDYVTRTPGAVAYLDAKDLRPGLQVVLRR